MCLAIVKPNGTYLDYHELREGFRSNKDGAGFAYAKNGKLIVRKGFFSFRSFIKAYRKERVDEYAALVHFRLATSGLTDEYNCHPWIVSRNIAVIHNGVLPWESDLYTSDTGRFVQDVLSPYRNKIGDRKFQTDVEKMIGRHNKLAFLTARGEHLIYNEEQGHWRDGVWYSNHSYVVWDDWKYDLSEYDVPELDQSWTKGVNHAGY